MKDNDKNIIDSFLDKYEELNSKKKVNIETYYRPSKAKSIFGFIFCLIFMIILIRIFIFSIVFFVIFFGDLMCLIYFGLNSFTEKGFVIKQKYRVPEHYLKQEEEQEEIEEDSEEEVEDEEE